jgi:tetraacyldisaccharide 4'-kinase
VKALLERYLLDRWYGGRRSPLWLRALVPLYRILAARRWERPAERPPCPVIVVGNITAGGSGKTPVTAALARILIVSGFAPAIVSRGHGGRTGRDPRAVTPASDPADVGDEPVLLARRAGCPVWVGRDRFAALQAARAGGAGVILSDDGLQHPRLPRSFEICVIDGLRGLGNARLLPAGPLRQPVKRLGAVDLVLLKQAGGTRRDTGASGLWFEVAPGQPYRLDGAGGEGGSPPEGAEFDAVCAIGNPDSFFALLEALGYRYRKHSFPDHHAFSAAELGNLHGPLIVTEKDAVKLERLAGLPETWVLPIEARLPEAAREAVLAHVREFRPA